MPNPIFVPIEMADRAIRLRIFGKGARPLEAPSLIKFVSVVHSSALRASPVLFAHDSTKGLDCPMPYTVCRDVRGLLHAMKMCRRHGIRQDGIVLLEKSMFCGRRRFEGHFQVYSICFDTFGLVHMSGKYGGEISTLATREVQSCSARIVKHFSSRSKIDRVRPSWGKWYGMAKSRGLMLKGALIPTVPFDSTQGTLMTEDKVNKQKWQKGGHPPPFLSGQFISGSLLSISKMRNSIFHAPSDDRVTSSLSGAAKGCRASIAYSYLVVQRPCDR
jgi:hypothetical protein